MNTEHVVARDYGFKAWLVVFSSALFFFYEFIQLNMFNAISPSLMKAFDIDAVRLGNLSASYLYVDVLLLLPAGLILDRFSTRKVILAAMFLAVFSTFIFTLSDSPWVVKHFSITGAYWLAVICHGLAGAGSAFCFLSCIRLASRWFPPKQLALVIGLIVTFAMAGGMVAQTPMTLLTETYGWRDALLIVAVFGAVIIGIIWLFVQDQPEGFKGDVLAIEQLGFWEGLRKVLLNKQNWLCGIYTSLLNIPIMVLGAVWGGLYLRQVYDFTAKQASYITMMIFLGTIIGSPLVGWISDRIGRRKMPMIVGAILSMAVISVIFLVPGLSLFSMIVLFLLLGIFTSAQILSYPAITESNSKASTGAANGVAAVLIMGGGAIAQPLYGWIMDLHWNGKIVDGLRVYSIESYHYAMLIIPIGFLLGLLAAVLMRETFAHQITDNN